MTSAAVLETAELRDRARDRLRELAKVDDLSRVDASELYGLAMQLKGKDIFNYARQLLAYARRARTEDSERVTKLRQQHALCTYKDPDLPVLRRLDRGLEILTEGESLHESVDGETLSIAGAIYKRKWEVEGDTSLLESALACYSRAYEAAKRGLSSEGQFVVRLKRANALGYPGVNVAFLLDLLTEDASTRLRRFGSADDSAAAARREQARAVRVATRDALHPLLTDFNRVSEGDRWWSYVTLAEAALGLGNYEEARQALRQAKRADVEDWQRESTARQLARVAKLQRGDEEATAVVDSEAWGVVRELWSGQSRPLTGAITGKVGLALSGGGFRASLFHLGVLARLAELGVLPSVEVLSCVSGGSIVGAHYYLELRHLLQTKSDAEIGPQDYVNIVQRMHVEFLEGVQRNIRTKALAELITSVRMIFQPHFTRTQRLGDLYERLLYARVADGEGSGDRWLSGLFVVPAGGQGKFNPKKDNWSRTAKVPMLVVNATTLNTGHNWQFTASWMGEPPWAIDPEVDGNDRLRRMYYDEQAPERYNRVRLGRAVAASSCVPGLFEPISMPGLYPERSIRLVDGGVYDNQGTASLLEQDCAILIVSDASGQMESMSRPSGGPVGVLFRSNGILQARVRSAQYQEISARLRSSRLRGMMFLHLKKGLDSPPVGWVKCKEPVDPEQSGGRRASAKPGADKSSRGGKQDEPTEYGIRKRVQTLLAAVRTDLDSFSDAEAYALMLSGYRMAEREFAERIPDFPQPTEPLRLPNWKFLALEGVATANGSPVNEEAQRRLDRRLEVSAQRFFKVWRLPSFRLALTTVLVLAAGWLVWLGVREVASRIDGPPRIFGSPLSWSSVPVLLVAWGFVRRFAFKESITQVVTGMLLGVVGVVMWIVNRLHLHVFDPIYLRQGKIDKVTGR
jgi:predicted acylesterase/phospholipase RssA